MYTEGTKILCSLVLLLQYSVSDFVCTNVFEKRKLGSDNKFGNKSIFFFL